MANAILNVGQTGGQVNISTAAAPATPAAGIVTLYAGTDKALHALNSDGTDITIAAGMTGPTGPQGQTGATGPAGSNATSPITLEQTNSLVSTAIGATAGAGANCAVVVGNGAVAIANASDSVVIGNGAKHCTYGAQSVVIGPGALATNSGTISIGYLALGESPNSVNIGTSSCTVCGLVQSSIAIGRNSKAYGLFDPAISADTLADIAIGYGAVARFGDSLAMGQLTFACANKGISIGGLAKVFPGATGTIVLGNSSVGGTGACNSVVIGNTSRTTSACSVVIGQAACAIGVDATKAAGIAIGKGAIARDYAVVIGFEACNVAGGYGAGSVAIGYRAIALDFQGIAIGGGACAKEGIAIGAGSVSCGDGGTISMAYQSLACGNSISLGAFSCATTGCSLSIGWAAKSNQACAISIGVGSLSCHSAAAIIGPNLTSIRANTTHVDSLVAFGQAASLTNAVGSTGGSVTLNWDNSNIQTLTLTSNITTLTKSNPIDGAVYTLFLTQGGSGGYTVDFGADVNFAGGTGPTLSTAIGATDAVSLVYIAGITGYYGNANLNFA